MLSSFPHFYRADKSVLDYVDGLEPKEELHDSYLDLHPVSCATDFAIRSYVRLLGPVPRDIDAMMQSSNLRDGRTFDRALRLKYRFILDTVFTQIA